MMKTVYLAGPITGLTYGAATDWREQAKKYLADRNIQGLSPLRCKEYLMMEKKIRESYDDYVLSTAKGITVRDRWDCFRCDVVLVNFIGAEKVSIGSVLEIAWADSAKKPIVCCMENGNVHNHAMIEQCCGFVVDSLDKGLDVVSALLA